MDAYEALSECCSKRHLDVLFRDNPGRICQDKPVLELEPLPFYHIIMIKGVNMIRLRRAICLIFVLACAVFVGF